MGLAVGGGSFVADIAHEVILPHINKSAKLSNVESALLQLAVSGLATSLILIEGASAPLANLFNMVLLGAGSAVAGSYLENNFLGGTSNMLY